MVQERLVRRLAAILAADVAGYSRLMGADEEGTHERLKAHLGQLVEPKIKEHRGRTVKNTGDGLLSEFASVVDAMRCAMEIQRGMAERERGVPDERRIAFRIGINLGDVIAEEHDIFGDGVNIAARLEALAEPGGICVSARVQEDVTGKLDLMFEDLGDQQLKNIARPVCSFRVTGFTRKVLPDTVNIPPSPDKPSVAVLAFTNVGGDSTYEYLSDGIADDIIASLSRCPWLFVIARNSSFTFKGRPVDVKQVGRELGVRYVLEGGVRKAGTRIRVTAQLVESETGTHVWASSFNKDLVDIFTVQEEISEAVSIAVAPAIADAEVRRALRKPDRNLDAWSAFQRGLWHFSKFNPDDNVLAQKLFQQSVDFDPMFSGGYKGLCWSLCQAATTLLTHELAEALTSAEALARRAVALDGADAEARSSLALTLWLQGDLEGAKAEAEQAIEASPNLAFANAMLGATLLYSGQPKEGIVALEKAIRVDPYDPGLVSRLSHLAAACYFNHQYYNAIEIATRAIRSNLNYPSSYRWLAAGLGQLGRQTEAKQALEKALVAAPTLVDMYARKRPPWMQPEDQSHMLD